MPPKTRRAAATHEDTIKDKQEQTAPTDPKKQKLESEEGNNENGHDTTNSATNQEFTKDDDLVAKHTRSHDQEKEETENMRSNDQPQDTEKQTNIKKNETEEKNEQPSTSDKDTKILEKGKIVFYFRPKIDHETVKSANDIQRFTFAMSPEGKDHHRLVVVGSKTFPELGSRSRGFAFVEKVTTDIDELNSLLLPYDYDTKTKGERHQEGSRVAGEALYEIVQSGHGVHLAYVLDIPEQPTETQQTFNIHKEGALLCSVRNPTAGPSSTTGARGLPNKQKAQYPSELMEHFKGKVKSSLRFASLLPEFLDHEGCEILMVATGKDAQAELKDIMEDLEKEAEELEQMIDKHTDHHPQDNIYEERNLDKEVNPDATEELK
jgi:hypothetical protein